MAYRSDYENPRQLTWLDRTGRPLDTLGTPDPYGGFRLSKNEKSIAARRFDRRTGHQNIWHIDVASGVGYPLTTNRNGGTSVWSPDGTEIIFTSDQLALFDLYRRPLDRSKPEQLLHKSSNDKQVNDWSSDGKFLLFVEWASKTGGNIWLLALDQPEPKLLLQTKANEWEAKFSPDVRWIAYTSDESGQNQIYVQSFPDAAIRVPVSRDGGTNPKWNPQGKELFFVSRDNALMSVEVHGDASGFRAGPPKALFTLPMLGPPPVVAGYDISADGQRFLMNLQVPGSTAQHITMVLNWLAGGKR